MMCLWRELLSILPTWLRSEVSKTCPDQLQELRLRINAPPELVSREGSFWLERAIDREDLLFVVNTASRYSPWAASSAAKGYITAPGGHRIGMCGEVILRNGAAEGYREVDSLCIRVAKDYPGIGKKALHAKGSILILGAPGSGKTTLLRDILRQISQTQTVCVVDERCELFPKGFDRGPRMDVLTGCPKPDGLDRLLRTMGPACLAVDEITAEEDSEALLRASNCGVRLLATAHAASLQDFQKREVYRHLNTHRIFQTLIQLKPDKSYILERMNP